MLTHYFEIQFEMIVDLSVWHNGKQLFDSFWLCSYICIYIYLNVSQYDNTLLSFTLFYFQGYFCKVFWYSPLHRCSLGAFNPNIFKFGTWDLGHQHLTMLLNVEQIKYAYSGQLFMGGWSLWESTWNWQPWALHIPTVSTKKIVKSSSIGSLLLYHIITIT